MKVLQWYVKTSSLYSSQTRKERMGAKDVRHKSPINTAIIIIDVVSVLHTKHLGKTKSISKGVIRST